MDTVKKGHPKGLYILFFSEAWERFSFYGMRALLVLYLVNQLKYDRHDALRVYATYLGLVYLTPVVGGYIADKILGARKAIITGGILMTLGHLAMASPDLIFTGMGLIIAGNGFFKPNISTIVGSLYEQGDPRRDGAFTIFYMGINLGAMFSPLVCGYLGEKISWEYGFSAASIGMALGLVVFVWGQKLLGTAGFPPDVEATKDTRLKIKDWRDIVLFVIGAVILVAAILKFWAFIGPYWENLAWSMKLMVGVLLVALPFVWNHFHKRAKDVSESAEKFTREEIERLSVLLIVFFFVIFFWMGFEQAGGTMNLFADKLTDRHLWLPWNPGWEMPASFFQALNPFFIIVLAPIFSWVWSKNDSSKWGLSTPAKMAWGMIILGLGFIVMYFGQGVANTAGKAGIQWLIAVYFLHTIGELCLSPIGLSLVTKLSPTRIVSTMMGLWFVASAISDYLAGRMEEITHHFQIDLWTCLISTSIGAGIVLLILTPWMKKWMHGKG